MPPNAMDGLCVGDLVFGQRRRSSLHRVDEELGVTIASQNVIKNDTQLEEQFTVIYVAARNQAEENDHGQYIFDDDGNIAAACTQVIDHQTDSSTLVLMRRIGRVDLEDGRVLTLDWAALHGLFDARSITAVLKYACRKRLELISKPVETNRRVMRKRARESEKAGRASAEGSLCSAADLVGRRVRVWWADDVRWYEGTVQAHDPYHFEGSCWMVLYDDGDSDWYDLPSAIADESFYDGLKFELIEEHVEVRRSPWGASEVP